MDRWIGLLGERIIIPSSYVLYLPRRAVVLCVSLLFLEGDGIPARVRKTQIKQQRHRHHRPIGSLLGLEVGLILAFAPVNLDVETTPWTTLFAAAHYTANVHFLSSSRQEQQQQQQSQKTKDSFFFFFFFCPPSKRALIYNQGFERREIRLAMAPFALLLTPSERC